MYNEILITVSESGAISANNTVLLMEGENDSKSFRVRLPIRFANDWVYIEFKQSNGDKFVSKRLESYSNGEFLYLLKKEVLSCVGELKVQIVIKNGSGLIGKSNTLIFTVKGSINATEELVEKETSQELLLDVQEQLDKKQDKLIAGANISLVETEQGVIINSTGGSGSKKIVIVDIEELIATQNQELFLELSKQLSLGEIVVVGKVGEVGTVVSQFSYNEEHAEWIAIGLYYELNVGEIINPDILFVVIDNNGGTLHLRTGYVGLDAIKSNKNDLERIFNGVYSVNKAVNDGDGNKITETYERKDEAVKSLELNNTNYVLTLKDGKGNTLSTVDLPLESTVVGGSYDDTNKTLNLTLVSGEKISIPVNELVTGLASESYVDDKVSKKANQTDFDALLEALSETMPKVVRVF